jgi:hypothetical protein
MNFSIVSVNCMSGKREVNPFSNKTSPSSQGYLWQHCFGLQPTRHVLQTAGKVVKDLWENWPEDHGIVYNVNVPLDYRDEDGKRKADPCILYTDVDSKSQYQSLYRKLPPGPRAAVLSSYGVHRHGRRAYLSGKFSLEITIVIHVMESHTVQAKWTSAPQVLCMVLNASNISDGGWGVMVCNVRL